MSGPLSAVVATYNCGPFLGAAVDSLLAQTRPADEIIVIDDGSTDNTSDILAGYQGRVMTVLQANRGAAAARNAGIERARGRYIAVMDADDVLDPQRFELQMRALAGAPDAVASFTGHSIFDGHETIATYRGVAAHGLEPAVVHAARCLVLPATVMFDAAKARNVRYPLSITCGEDMLFVAQLRQRGHFAVLPDVLYGYRRRAGQATSRFTFINGFEQRVAWMREHWALESGDPTDATVARMWTEFARELESFYWTRDRDRFLELKDYLKAQWPVGTAPPDAIDWRWHPDWLWNAKETLFSRARAR